MDKLIFLVPVMGLIGLLYTFAKFNWVSKPLLVNFSAPHHPPTLLVVTISAGWYSIGIVL